MNDWLPDRSQVKSHHWQKAVDRIEIFCFFKYKGKIWKATISSHDLIPIRRTNQVKPLMRKAIGEARECITRGDGYLYETGGPIHNEN